MRALDHLGMGQVAAISCTAEVWQDNTLASGGVEGDSRGGYAMSYPRNDNDRVQAVEVGKADTTATGLSSTPPMSVKAPVLSLPGAHRRSVPRCDGCGSPVAFGVELCGTCASGKELVARIEQRRADSLRQQAQGESGRAGG